MPWLEDTVREPTEEYLLGLGNVRDEYELALEGSVDLVYSNGRPDKVYDHDKVLKNRKNKLHSQRIMITYKVYIFSPQPHEIYDACNHVLQARMTSSLQAFCVFQLLSGNSGILQMLSCPMQRMSKISS